VTIVTAEVVLLTRLQAMHPKSARAGAWRMSAFGERRPTRS
jgi:hypothetical protein